MTFYVQKPFIISAHKTGQGDYIVTGTNDKKYTCKADIFERTYEEVDVIDIEEENSCQTSFGFCSGTSSAI